ncbi:MAG: response regulator [Deltaproteobacteria bacterium]|nr:response regulator [Deltaproteobacteria bacterium]
MTNKILIVDDTETMRLTEQMMLKDEDCSIEMASNGVEAIEKIKINKPDLILMDIMMPEMDGIECCRQIKSDSSLSDIKVVMVTTRSEYARVKEAFTAGCDDYINKPIDKEELLTKVNDLLKFVSLRKLLQN